MQLRDGDALVIGRDAELTVLDGFLAPDRPQWALVLTGEPGIGKTTLWEAGIEAARAKGLQVLSSRPSGAETELSYAALGDLLDGTDLRALPELPAPQVRELEIALLRADPEGSFPQPRAVAVGLWNALRAIADSRQIVIAIDDVQWLDRASSDALSFVARRLETDRVAFLLTRRGGSPSVLEQAVNRDRLDWLALDALSLGATRRLLVERLGLSVPRHVLRRIFETTLGNPLFALEIGRMLVEQGVPDIGDEIPLPDSVENVLGNRVARLPAPVRRLLLAVALSGDLRASELADLAESGVIDDAFDAGVLILDGDRVRASHPLLAAAARKSSKSRARRELHLQLAGVVADQQLRARHIALATTQPDEHVATVVSAAAAGASHRGARQEAVELGEHALRLTPSDSAERGERLLALAEYLPLTGEKDRASDLLLPALDLLPAGPARARALIMLVTGVVTSGDDIERYFERALDESRNDPALHATLLANRASNEGILRVTRIAEAEALAERALPLARRAGRNVEQVGQEALTWMRVLRGLPIDDLLKRHEEVSDAASFINASPERPAAQRLAWRGGIASARGLLTRLLSLADDRAESVSYAVLRLHLCELELRAGELEAAARLLQEWSESSEGDLITSSPYQRCMALLAAERGEPSDAERHAAEVLVLTDETGNNWDRLEALRARGIAFLLAHEPARAAETLRIVWEHTEREGVEEPGAFPVAPELVEALVELGEMEEAGAVIGRLRKLAEEQQHPWGLATVRRCDALMRLASPDYDEDAAARLADAASEYGKLGLRFDRSRSLLSLGRAQRRLRKWAAARTSLEEAAAGFEEIGAPGWADQARSELTRVGARRAVRAGELTPAEQGVVELAAEGFANKEIAARLFISVGTVEVHLSHAYAKLDVRSRSQLAGRLSTKE